MEQFDWGLHCLHRRLNTFEKCDTHLNCLAGPQKMFGTQMTDIIINYHQNYHLTQPMLNPYIA